MTFELVRSRGRILLLAMLGACDGSTGPHTRSITLHVCDDSQWIAYQNEGGRWTLLGEGDGVYVFAATQRLVVARAFGPEGAPAPVIHVNFLTSDQVVEQLGCPATNEVAGTIGGGVTGIGQFQWAIVSFNGSTTFVPTGSTDWGMQAQRVPATLIAARYDSGHASVRANRVIIRRDRSYVPGTAAPLLDFESTEAFDPRISTLSFTARPGYVYVWYITRGRQHLMSIYPSGTFGEGEMPRSAPMHGIPTERLATGDVHLITQFDATRVTQLFVRELDDRSLTLGPPVVAPAFGTVASTPYRRIRVDLPSQPEYPEAVTMTLSQTRGTRTSRIMMNVTREYFGETPTVWSLTVPDLSGVPGFSPAASFDQGEFDYSVSVTSRRFGLGAATAQDGDRILSATRSGVSP